MSRELAIARFINWPMEVMGEAFKLISHLGGYLLDGVRALRNVVREAGGGAIRTVVEALERIAGKLSHIAEQVLGRVGGALERRGARALERDGGRVLTGEAERLEQRELAQALDHGAGREAREAGIISEDAQRGARQEGAAARTEPQREPTRERHPTPGEGTERLEAVTAARTVVAMLQTRHTPALLVRGALMPLRLRWRWIKGFELEPLGPGRYEVYLIASRIPVTVYFDSSAGGRQGPFNYGRTANTPQGISQIEGRRLPGNAESVSVAGQVQPSLTRGTGGAAPSFERELPLASTLPGVPNDYQRAHLWGPGWGDEARAGLMYAPPSVNQHLQTLGHVDGIEGWVRQFHDEARAAGGRVHVIATAESYPRAATRDPLLLKEVQYDVGVHIPGQPPRFYRAHIEVPPPPGTRPTIEISEILRAR